MGQKLAHGSRQTIKQVDDQYIALAGDRQGGGKPWAIGMGVAHRFLEHPLAPGSMEGVDLTIGGVQIGRDASVRG
jgi:hypothetical protein